MPTPSERFRKSVTNDNLWMYILTLLKDESLYAYQINEMIRKRFGFSPGNVTAYIILKRLQADGYVRLSEKKVSGGPERSYYKLTEKGTAEIEKARKIYKNMGNVF